MIWESRYNSYALSCLLPIHLQAGVLIYPFTHIKSYHSLRLNYHISFSVQDGEDGQVDAPLWMGLIILVLFTTLMAGVFCWIEGWDFGTSLYFQYITFLTIGFGDVVPEKEEVYCTFLFIFTIKKTSTQRNDYVHYLWVEE